MLNQECLMDIRRRDGRAEGKFTEMYNRPRSRTPIDLVEQAGARMHQPDENSLGNPGRQQTGMAGMRGLAVEMLGHPGCGISLQRRAQLH